LKKNSAIQSRLVVWLVGWFVGSLFGYLVISHTCYLTDTLCGSCLIRFNCVFFLAECSFVCRHRCLSETRAFLCLRIRGTWILSGKEWRIDR